MVGGASGFAAFAVRAFDLGRGLVTVAAGICRLALIVTGGGLASGSGWKVRGAPPCALSLLVTCETAVQLAAASTPTSASLPSSRRRDDACEFDGDGVAMASARRSRSRRKGADAGARRGWGRA